MLDLQRSFNKQHPRQLNTLSDTNMNCLVFSKEFLVFNKVSNCGNINFVLHCFVWDGILTTRNRAYSRCTIADSEVT